MMRRRLALIALLAVFGLLVAACGDDATETTAAPGTTAATTTTAAPPTTEAPTTTEAPVTTAPPAALKLCQVTDVGGIDDGSFNTTAWEGALLAQQELGFEVAYLESQAATDYRPNIEAFVSQGCDLIVTVGFMLAADTALAACDYPDQMFAIIDQQPEFYPGSSWADADGNPLCDFAKVRGLMFQTDEAAFLAGYLAAGMSTTGVVGTFGGMQFPSVTIFMDGFAWGVDYYNTVKGTDVQVLGWDPATQTGLFTGDFESLDNARALTENLSDEGADVILPVGGPIGKGAAAVGAERGLTIFGVDSDWCVSALVADTCPQVLASIMKNMAPAVLNTAINLANLGAVGNAYLGTLSNDGVGLTYGAELVSTIPAELIAEIEAIRLAIIAADNGTPDIGDGLDVFLAPPAE